MIWPYIGSSWPHLGSSWGHLGALLGRLGPPWGHPGASWGRLGRPRGRLGATLGPSWTALGPSCGNLVSSWANLVPLGDHFGVFWARFWPIWGPYSAHVGFIWGPCEAHLGEHPLLSWVDHRVPLQYLNIPTYLSFPCLPIPKRHLASRTQALVGPRRGREAITITFRKVVS